MTAILAPKSKAPRRRKQALGGTRDGKRYPRARDDFYIEEEFCNDALILAEAQLGKPLAGLNWDPSCGSGTIPRRLAAHGLRCISSDLRDRRPDIAKAEALCGWSGRSIADSFFQLNFLDPDLTSIEAALAGREKPATAIFNPPYGKAILARAFIARGMLLAGRVCALVQSRFLHSQDRHAFFSAILPPARIYHLSQRPSMPPGKAYLDKKVKRGGGRHDFCWLVYEREHAAPAQTYWLMMENGILSGIADRPGFTPSSGARMAGTRKA